MALLMCSNAVDSALLTHDKASDQWQVALLDDTARVSVPLVGEDFTEHFPLGLAASFNSTQPVQISMLQSNYACLIAVFMIIPCIVR